MNIDITKHGFRVEIRVYTEIRPLCILGIHKYEYNSTYKIHQCSRCGKWKKLFEEIEVEIPLDLGT